MKSVVLFWAIVLFAFRVQRQRTDFLHTDFAKADSIAALYPHHSLKDLKALATKLTQSLATEEEKFRSVYKWVCDNIEFDYDLFQEHKLGISQSRTPSELKQWNRDFTSRVFQVLHDEQKTVCTGYAYLLRELSLHAGLRCEIVDGYGRTTAANVGGKGIPNHSWNAVLLHNKWYLCDATWSSGAYHPEAMKFVKKFEEGYFLTEPSLFVRNHYPLDTAWMLLKQKPPLTAFLHGPLVYGAAFKHSIEKIFPETFELSAEKGKPVSFEFATSNNQRILSADLFSNGNRIVKVINPQIADNGRYHLDHTFTTKGVRTVHIRVNADYVFSYSVTVR